jgi:D-sedoheptulose 7-phosphate isomerase
MKGADRGAAVRDHLSELSSLSARVADELISDISALTDEVLNTIQADRKIMFCGNGGSAADAQHLATEYVVRFAKERRALPALALTTDTSLLTAGANDYGYEMVFARQIEALGRSGDLLVLHSTSGESDNLITAAHSARKGNIRTAALLAKGGGRLAAEVDLPVIIPTNSTARAQEMHLAIGHIVCALVDNVIAGDA